MNQQTASTLQVVGYASFLQRLSALLLDCLLFLPLNFWSQYNLFNGKSFAVAAIITAVWCVYKPLMDWKYGGTVGKLVMKLRVIDTNRTGISLNQSLLRFIPYFAVSLSTLTSTYMLLNLPGFDAVVDWDTSQEFAAQGADSLGLTLSYFFYLFSVSSIFLNEQKQALHDKIAQCCCVVIQPLPKGAEERTPPQSLD